MSRSFPAALFTRVANDLQEAFGAEAHGLAIRAQRHMIDLGDSEGAGIWDAIAEELANARYGALSAAIH